MGTRVSVELYADHEARGREPVADVMREYRRAIFVMGVEKGLKLIESYPDYETIIVDAAGKVSYSKGLTPD